MDTSCDILYTWYNAWVCILSFVVHLRSVQLISPELFSHERKHFKTILFSANHVIKILNSRESIFIIDYEMPLKNYLIRRFALVVFYGISTFVRYLMPNPAYIY